MTVTAIPNIDQFKTAVIDFWVTWCGPCTIPVVFEECFNLEENKFYKADVKLNGEIAREPGIRASMPTLKRERSVDESAGDNSQKLEQILRDAGFL